MGMLLISIKEEVAETGPFLIPKHPKLPTLSQSTSRVLRLVWPTSSTLQEPRYVLRFCVTYFIE